eukprot:gnl/Chilomastix_cuspidata/1511.p2 GENE.gnl/Chilomastix_cuspidata/1511~~gnl/Chilomastix_cuspidata/1511.p2  ORF type:complete len:192 (-),score=85.38 gnl/Chilomastix_cuspidata/1511:22-597(-)
MFTRSDLFGHFNWKPMGTSESRARGADLETIARLSNVFNLHEVKKMYKEFSRVDLDGNGSISPEEIAHLSKISIDEARVSIAIMDTNDDGEISFEEWIRFKEFKSPLCTFEQRARILISLLDADGDGTIDLAEWEAYLRRLLPHIPDAKFADLAKTTFKDLTDKHSIGLDDILSRRAIFASMFEEIAKNAK